MVLRRARWLGALAAAMTGLATASYADSNRYDWQCSGASYQWCNAYGIGLDWGSATAVNSIDPYYKCAGLYLNASFINLVCASSTNVRTQTDDFSLGGQTCLYPNNATSGGCAQLFALVSNGTGVSHGLRGVGYY
jgi:hypothetical protein